MKMNKITIGLALAVGMFTSCENQDISFDDFEYQTVYFANQYPVRTIELGDDMFVDNSIDNEHKFEIKATIGGLYTNKQNVEIDYVVDETLWKTSILAKVPKDRSFRCLPTITNWLPKSWLSPWMQLRAEWLFN